MCVMENLAKSPFLTRYLTYYASVHCLLFIPTIIHYIALVRNSENVRVLDNEFSIFLHLVNKLPPEYKVQLTQVSTSCQYLLKSCVSR